MSDDTLLVITGMGVTPFSARGLTQTLEPISAAASPRRTINGVARDVSMSQFHKYRSAITCRDQSVPAVDGVWPGTVVTVDCVAELSYLTSGGVAQRPVVPGSSRVVGDFTFYRPRLTMIVEAFDESVAEWDAEVAWRLVLEEE
jgi:hypothetical protein